MVAGLNLDPWQKVIWPLFQTISGTKTIFGQKIQMILKPSRKWEMIWKNPNSCETFRKMGSDLEKSGWLRNCPKNGQWSGKTHTVFTPSGKWKMIWKDLDRFEIFRLNLDSFDTVQKIGNNLEISWWIWNRQETGKWSGKIRTIWHRPENRRWSGKILTVVEHSGKWEMIRKNMDSFKTN